MLVDVRRQRLQLVVLLLLQRGDTLFLRGFFQRFIVREFDLHSALRQALGPHEEVAVVPHLLSLAECGTGETFIEVRDRNGEAVLAVGFRVGDVLRLVIERCCLFRRAGEEVRVCGAAQRHGDVHGVIRDFQNGLLDFEHGGTGLHLHFVGAVFHVFRGDGRHALHTDFFDGRHVRLRRDLVKPFRKAEGQRRQRGHRKAKGQNSGQQSFEAVSGSKLFHESVLQ